MAQTSGPMRIDSEWLRTLTDEVITLWITYARLHPHAAHTVENFAAVFPTIPMSDFYRLIAGVAAWHIDEDGNLHIEAWGNPPTQTPTATIETPFNEET